MKVFLSWSGDISHEVAVIFKEWLPSVIQSIEPYVSSEDIDKGTRWSTDIAEELENSTFGILCVTKENLDAPWLNFEAGALSKTMDKTFVSPFLFDIKRSEVNGPISQFQSTIFKKDDIEKLIKTLNKACGEESLPDNLIMKALEVWYPPLEKQLKNINTSEQKPDINKKENKDNNYEEALEEVLNISRMNQQLLRMPNKEIEHNISEIKEDIQNIRNKISKNNKISDCGKKNLSYVY